MRKLLSRKVYQLNYPHGPCTLLRIFLESHMGLGSHLVLLDSSLPVSFRLQYPPCNHFYTIRRMDVKALSPAHFMRGIVHCGGAKNPIPLIYTLNLNVFVTLPLNITTINRPSWNKRPNLIQPAIPLCNLRFIQTHLRIRLGDEDLFSS